jgi:DNA-binding transcriptional LysR family regulator
MPVEFASLHFGALLPRFLSRHPGLTVHLLATNDVVDLVEDGVDVAVRFVRQYDGALPGRQLGITRILLLASPQYVAVHGAPRSVEDVGERDGLVYGSPAPWLEFPCWSNGTEGRLRLKPHVVSSSSDVLRSTLVQGVGVAVLTTMQAGSDLRDGRLVRLLPELDLGCMRVYVVYPNRRHLPAKVRAFVEFLGECFGGRPDVDPFVDGLHRP